MISEGAADAADPGTFSVHSQEGQRSTLNQQFFSWTSLCPDSSLGPLYKGRDCQWLKAYIVTFLSHFPVRLSMLDA